MEPCWEYFHCIKDNCVVFGRRDVSCWTVEGTLCNNATVAYRRPAFSAFYASRPPENRRLKQAMHMHWAVPASLWARP